MTEAKPMTKPHQRKYNSRLKLISIGSLVIVVILTIQQLNFQQFLQTWLMWVEELGTVGAIAYIGIYNLATLLFVPGSILSIKGGCLFGLWQGLAYVSIAAICGATWAFLLGRYLSREWIRRKIGKNSQFQAIDRAVGRDGWKIVFLTRLSPIFPFNLLNYVFGVTQISLQDYILGSVGMIPGTIMYVYIGSLATDLTTLNLSNLPTNNRTKILQWIIRIIGALATVAVTVYTSHLAKKALEQSIVEDREVAHGRSKKP